jgi:hypothetical protein
MVLSSRKYDPDPNLDFLPIPDPGVKKEPDPESASLFIALLYCTDNTSVVTCTRDPNVRY